jgi:hypothetical protein
MPTEYHFFSNSSQVHSFLPAIGSPTITLVVPEKVEIYA